MRDMDLEGEEMERIEEQLQKEQMYNQRHKWYGNTPADNGGGGATSGQLKNGVGCGAASTLRYIGGMFLLLSALHTAWTQVYAGAYI